MIKPFRFRRNGFFQYVKPGKSINKHDHEGWVFLKGPAFNDTGFIVFHQDGLELVSRFQRMIGLLSDWFFRIWISWFRIGFFGFSGSMDFFGFSGTWLSAFSVG
jgi:hypothetical protein